VKDPRVSVCIPTYNYAELLPRAIESVLEQTFDDFELLVYDDASTDETVEVMQRYLEDPRVTLVVQEQNQGLFANFDQSASQARGEYIKYLCADDWLDRRFLERTVPVLDAQPAAQLLTTAHWHVDYEGQLYAAQVAPFGSGPIDSADHAALQLALWGNVVGMPTNTLIRRSALEAVGGFDAHYAPGADVHLWLKLLALGDLAWVPEKLCYWRIHRRHTHDYGPDPSESMFLIWEDAPQLENSPVSAATSQAGVDGEAMHYALHAGAHLLRGRLARARALMAVAGRHVSLTRLLGLLLTRLPRMAFDQLRRLIAVRRGRLVIYDPRPRGGPPLASVDLDDV
jgi:cellulose synthase/poly-beta-1,6-N-acetylglucosamine synthase-like glycosyltransferase